MSDVKVFSCLITVVLESEALNFRVPFFFITGQQRVHNV